MWRPAALSRRCFGLVVRDFVCCVLCSLLCNPFSPGPTIVFQAACALCCALCESVFLSCSESVLLSRSNSPSWPSRSRCCVFVETRPNLPDLMSMLLVMPHGCAGAVRKLSVVSLIKDSKRSKLTQRHLNAVARISDQGDKILLPYAAAWGDVVSQFLYHGLRTVRCSSCSPTSRGHSRSLPAPAVPAGACGLPLVQLQSPPAQLSTLLTDMVNRPQMLTLLKVMVKICILSQMLTNC